MKNWTKNRIENIAGKMYSYGYGEDTWRDKLDTPPS